MRILIKLLGKMTFGLAMGFCASVFLLLWYELGDRRLDQNSAKVHASPEKMAPRYHSQFQADKPPASPILSTAPSVGAIPSRAPSVQGHAPQPRDDGPRAKGRYQPDPNPGY